MTLTKKFILVILFITSLVVSVFTYIQINEQQEILKSELQQRINLIRNNIDLNAKYIINNLKYDVENDIASFNFSHIEVSFQKLIKNKNIITINMYNLDKSINLFTGDKSFNNFSDIKNIQEVTIKEINNGENFIISTPLNFSDKWGSLHIVYSLSNLKKEVLIQEQLINTKIHKSIQKSIYTAIIFSLLIILFAYIFTRRFLAPILLLTEIAKQIANGKMNVNNEFENIQRKDEIGILYHTFKDMSSKLESSYEKLKKLNENLEAKVIKRTKQLHLEKQKAEEATKVKSEFLATMSHEIRTPMNGILGMAYLTLQTSLNQQQKDFIIKIEKSAKSLMTIINDILDFSKLEATKLTISNIDFNLLDLIHNVISILKIEADKNNLKILLNYNIEQYNFHGDSLRISQILTNIIGNAIKFTPHGEISIEVSNTSQNRYRFSISDTGIGLTEEEISKLFQSFSQADSSTTRKYGGTGLGLAISKQLAELMDGKIWVESTKDIGSIFHIEIEIKPLNKQYPSKQLLQSSSLTQISSLPNAKILLVEDNKINQEIISGLLDNSSIEVDIANNGKEALDIFDPDLHKIIFMDIKMPIMNGIEATVILRENNHTVPIIALTANAMNEDIIKTQEAGMNEHLNKPIDIEKLYTILSKYLIKKLPELNIPQFKTINSDYGLTYINNNKKLYLNILKSFYNDYKNFNFDLLNDIEKDSALHILKSLSANIGAEKLCNYIKEFELSSSQNSIDLIQNELTLVIKDLEILNDIKDSNKQQLLELSPELKKQLFNELYQVIDQKKPKLCSEVVEKIALYKLEDKDASVFKNILIKINQYNFKQANNLLEEIL